MLHIFPLHEKDLHDLSDRTGCVCNCGPRLETECAKGNPLGVPIVHHTPYDKQNAGVCTTTLEDTSQTSQADDSDPVDGSFV